MTWDDVLVDGVDTIDASRWNDTVTQIKSKSVTTHTHSEFQIYSGSESWYVYKIGSTYYAKNMNTGTVDYSGLDFSVVMTSVKNAMINGGFIKLGTGTFVIQSASSGVIFGTKSIIVEGSGWGSGTDPTSNSGTLITSDTSGNFYLFTFGQSEGAVRGSGIRNCMFYNPYATNTDCLGAVRLFNTSHSFIDHCLFYGFGLGNAASMKAVTIYGDDDMWPGGTRNRVTNNQFYESDVGVFLGMNADFNLIINNEFWLGGNTPSYGVLFDGVGAAARATPVGCNIFYNRFRGIDQVGSRAIMIKGTIANSGYHLILGNEMNLCRTCIEIETGTTVGGHKIIDNDFDLSTSTVLIDSGTVKSFYQNNKNYVTENWGATASVSDGGTISHGLYTTPTVVLVTGTVATNMFAVTAKSPTTFTVAIKTPTLPGSTQTIYWRAWV